MLRVADGDHVNWVLVVVLVALALLLAMVSSTGYGFDQPSRVPAAGRENQAAMFWRIVSQDTKGRKEVLTPSENWHVARELYLTGKFAESRKAFERVLVFYPDDPAVKMWAGMAAYRTGDRAGAARHWEAVRCDGDVTSEFGVWSAIALAAVHLEEGRVDLAARLILPLDGDNIQPAESAANHPIVSFYAALVYEELANAAREYRDAVEESLAEKFSPPLASADKGVMVSPNSKSWLVFLTKRALQRTIREAGAIEWTASIVPEAATAEPSLAPTVGELLEAIGSADFATKARQKLRALKLYESQPERKIEIFDAPPLGNRLYA